MNDIIRQFIASPTVVEAGKESEVTILPLRGKHFFVDGKEYGVYIHPMTVYRTLPENVPDTTAVAQNGVIRIKHVFDHEGEYELRFTLDDWNGQNPYKINVYALEKDLYELRPLKGDLHAHSNRSDGRCDVAEVMADFRRYGFDFGIMTDHNRYFGSEEAQEAYKDVDMDFTILRGEEVHTPSTGYPKLHIVNIMAKRSIDRIYVKERDRYEKEVAEIEKTLPVNDYSHMLAMAKWACNEIHRAEGLAVLPHPFWLPPSNPVYNVDSFFLKNLFESGWFDVYEICGGMRTHGINLSVAYFNDLRVKGLKMPTVSSSDEHATIGDPKQRFGNLFTVVFAKDNTRDSIYEAVKNGYCAAVEFIPDDFQREYRVYADFRFTMYTRFLIDYYFDRTRFICEPEGEMMMEYYLGVDGAKEILESMKGRTTRFYEAFFGRTDKPFYSLDSYLAFYRKYDRVQEEYGVPLRGAKLFD